MKNYNILKITNMNLSGISWMFHWDERRPLANFCLQKFIIRISVACPPVGVSVGCRGRAAN